MWLFTTRGFYSVVQHRDEPEKLIVRTRVREDIEALRELIPEIEPFSGGSSDYRWRATVTKAEWVVALAQLVADLDYPNFKNAVAKQQGRDRANAYYAIWDEMVKLQKSRDE